MFRSIRARVTLGSVAIAVVVLAGLAGVLGEQLRHVAGESVAAMARDDLQAYLADLRNQPDEEPDRPQSGVRLLVLSPQGGIAVDTLPAGLTASVEVSGFGVSRLHAGGVSYAAVGERFTNGRGVWRLWAVRDTHIADTTLQDFGRVLLLTIPVMIALVGLGAWLLVGAALRPVRRLRNAAERIRDAGAPARLPQDGARNELADLTETLNRFLAAQQESVERERRMVADASHELRTPLAVLTTQLELAHRHFGDAAALEATVVSAQANVRSLSRLATQLLELSALDSDRRPLGEASVGELITELMASVDRARALARPGVDVEFDLTGVLDEPVIAPLSATAFGRIADNLAMNAVRATVHGSVALELEQTPGRLVLTVTDTGSGVPAAFLPHAFDRFTRSEESRAGAAGGSGLGLALVRALVDSARGTVTLENGADGGAVARVVLPLAG